MALNEILLLVGVFAYALIAGIILPSLALDSAITGLKTRWGEIVLIAFLWPIAFPVLFVVIGYQQRRPRKKRAG
jgi:hypothetical protein